MSNPYSPTIKIIWVFIGSLLPFLLVELFRSQFYSVMNVEAYLVFHNMAEFFSIVVSFSIFGVGWFAYEQSRNSHTLFLAVIFLTIGLLDLFHTLGYAGMPAFVTSNSPIKSTQYWIAARLFTAFAFLASAYVYPTSHRSWLSKNILLFVGLAIPTLVFIGITFTPEYIPLTIVEGVGLTPFKKNSEYLIILVLAVSTIVYWRRMLKTSDAQVVYFLAAFVICIFSEAVFAGYKSVFDTYNVVGHLYKIVAFCLIYKSLFGSAIRNPYYSLIETNNQLRDEIAKRELLEKELIDYRENLRDLVVQRTSELEQAKITAEAANCAKSMFLANMSHELRTPLNAILGFSELMSLDSEATAKQKETLGVINRSGAHLLSMINDVLDISKIEAGRLELDIQPFDLVRFLQDIGVMINVRAAAKQLDFRLELVPDITQFIKTDSGKLRQVLINLLGNAIKFTETGSVVLRASAYPLANKILLIIEVIDSGVGIPVNQLDELFQPFVQVMQANSATEGTGLGLAISKSLIQLMGGQISVNSKFGVGSTFKIELPVELADATNVATDRNFKVAKSLAPNQPAWRLLVVDDKMDNRLLLVTALTDIGFEVHEAENGQDAIREFQVWQPHLIWMDMRMPVMDGYEATAKIRQLEGGDKVKIITLTASVFKEQHQRIIEMGCDAVLHKPFHITHIFAALVKYLGVKFIYDDTPTASVPVVAKITREMLEQLPADVLQKLHAAALILDTEAVDTVIESIRAIAPTIADGLDELAKGYQFDRIARLIEGVLPK